MSPNLKGVLLALVGTAMFSTAAALIKLAAAEYPVLQILFIRQAILFLVVSPAIVRGFPDNLRTRRIGLHAMRLTGAFVALVCGFWAVAVLPLTMATVLAFSSVFFTTLLAVPLLGERVHVPRAAAICVGFAGVLAVMRPSPSGIADIQALIPVAGAVGVAFAMVGVRKLSQTESAPTLLAYQAIFVGVLAGLPMPWLWVAPDIDGLILMVAIGLISSLGQWVGVYALRSGEAGLVSSIEYMKLIYATLLGYLLFSEWPDAYTLAGAALIVGAAVFTIHREARRPRAGRPVAAKDTALP